MRLEKQSIGIYPVVAVVTLGWSRWLGWALQRQRLHLRPDAHLQPYIAGIHITRKNMGKLSS